MESAMAPDMTERPVCDPEDDQRAPAPHQNPPGTPGVTGGVSVVGATPAGAPLRGARILLVDDEADLVEAVARALRREGCTVDVAYDGTSALERIAERDHDLVCLDITMPDLDGLEVCQRMRADRSLAVRPRVLMLTGRDSLADRVEGLDKAPTTI